MTRFTTQSGSVYEVDTANKKVRRLNGANDPTPRQGKDGEWRSYEDTTPIKVGSSVIIAWSADTKLLPETETLLASEGGMAIPTTMTSLVVSVEDV